MRRRDRRQQCRCPIAHESNLRSVYRSFVLRKISGTFRFSYDISEQRRTLFSAPCVDRFFCVKSMSLSDVPNVEQCRTLFSAPCVGRFFCMKSMSLSDVPNVEERGKKRNVTPTPNVNVPRAIGTMPHRQHSLFQIVFGPSRSWDSVRV